MEESKDMGEPPLLILEKPEYVVEITATHPMPADPVAAFKRWMNSFRSRRGCPPPERYVEGWPMEVKPDDRDLLPDLLTSNEFQEKQWESLSHRSSNLGTVKTATLSITSQSVVRSRGTTQSTTNQSIRSDARESLDSIRPALNPSIDEEAQHRAIKRRRVLRELITTECDYIFGLKALAEALFIFSVRPEIYHNVQQIRDTHEDFLSQIRKLTPISNLAAAEFDTLMPQGVHKRLSAIDFGLRALHAKSLRSRSFRTSMDSRLRALAAETKEALQVALEVGNLSASFKAYKVFCKNYGLLTVDVSLLRQSVPDWRIFDQGIEALSKSVASLDRQAQEENKAMSLNDLLIKPIQRLCKYPLLLEELLRWTHIQDDPSAHDGIRQILEQVRAVVCEINQITDNPVSKALVKKTFLLQSFMDLSAANTIDNIYKQLGPLSLCGVLHITYQTPEYITGGYMVCILFTYHFVIAKPSDDYRRLEPLTCLYIPDMKIDSIRNGEGLRCYGCLFSWKLIFQSQGKNYELVLSAASAREEKKWETEMLKSAAALTDMPKSVVAKLKEHSFLTLELAPLSGSNGVLPLIPRRPSMQALATSRTLPDSHNIIIKKTHCPQRLQMTESVDGEIERPKMSALCPALVLTARRQDRILLERAISAFYTRDVLPYPGMTLGKGDIFHSPGSLMRHLSRRPGLYRRSSCVSLSTAGYSAKSVTGATCADEKVHRKLGKSQEKSLRSVSRGKPATPDTDKGPILARHSKDIRRSKTWKGKGGPNAKAKAEIIPTSASNKGTETPDACSLRTSAIRRMFNSMSSRRTKRQGRMGLGSGV
ncbi:Rho guanyl nucleotide exchange factor [Aspergillus piperis CBS 112811]|uniref:Rho guanyl nucleotide exchange factor n=1 Tax=Aspergillus piperis CBS 112811 TaxID=1448313 RepID=A0A8G1R105_9EURO|nr:Rho guanyl nucleotide exchange factor [Aspergillus piperis CBS 112811]RAH55800.1 Rho guanyl nucleotide exchange factor [Aspergillus piperis CBS 112811]